MRWEYMTTPLMIHNTAAILNSWGDQGWELVQVVTGPEGGLVGYFKRNLDSTHGNDAAAQGLAASQKAAQNFEGTQA